MWQESSNFRAKVAQVWTRGARQPPRTRGASGSGQLFDWNLVRDYLCVESPEPGKTCI